LQNVIERSVILTAGDVFAVDDVWLPSQTPLAAPRAATSTKAEREPRTEREIIETALIESRGRIAGPLGAAAKLRIPASTLEHRIRALKISKKQFKFP
jgi:DNA-binding NtrC family response regulator